MMVFSSSARRFDSNFMNRKKDPKIFFTSLEVFDHTVVNRKTSRKTATASFPNTSQIKCEHRTIVSFDTQQHLQIVFVHFHATCVTLNVFFNILLQLGFTLRCHCHKDTHFFPELLVTIENNSFIWISIKSLNSNSPLRLPGTWQPAEFDFLLNWIQ